MPLVAKRSRHVPVAIPEVRVSRGIAVSPRQQSPDSQQPNVAYYQTLIGWRGRYRLYGIASAHFMCPSKPSDVANSR